MFYDKYIYLCNKNEISPSAAALEMGLSKTTVNRWKNGGGVTDVNVLKVAEYFGVTVDYLLQDEKTPFIPEGEWLSDIKKELIANIIAGSDDNAKFVLEMYKRMK